MQFSPVCQLRRILNSSYHPFHVIPKPAVWARRERLRRFIAWQYATQRTTVRAGNRKLNKIMIYMDMQQRDEKKFEKFYAEQRLDSALAENDIEYKHTRNMLDKAHILLDNLVLSQLAIYEPRTFESIVNLTRAMSLEEGREVLDNNKDLENIEVEKGWFGEPLPRKVYFDKGVAKDHNKVPRKLKVSEF